MNKFSISGRSASLLALLNTLIPPKVADPQPGQAADRLSVAPPGIAPFLANQKLTEFFTAQGDLSIGGHDLRPFSSAVRPRGVCL